MPRIPANPNPEMIALGERLRRRREELKLSQREVAESIGHTNGLISGIENGVPTRSETLMRVALGLGVTFAWLTTGEDRLKFVDGVDFLKQELEAVRAERKKAPKQIPLPRPERRPSVNLEADDDGHPVMTVRIPLYGDWQGAEALVYSMMETIDQRKGPHV